MATYLHCKLIGSVGLMAALALAGGDAALAATAGTAAAVQPVSSVSPAGTLAFLRVSLPKGPLYVGQSVPLTLKAYFRPGIGVTLAGAPNLGLGASTVSQLSEEPRQSVEEVGGVPYRVATWTGLVTAAMPGHYTPDATLPIVVRYREPAQRAAPDPADLPDPFAELFGEDDSMMPPSALLRSLMGRSLLGGDLDDFFGRVREREMTLHARVHPLEVLPLPTQGRPSDFSGAVGSFDIQATLDPPSHTGTAFEPLRLKIAISGHGSFDRVATAGATPSTMWKSYPPTPRFTPSGAAPTSAGIKVFEQTVVPTGSGRVELPSISFSFFEPAQGRYITRVTAPIAVQIAPAAASEGSTVAQEARAPRPDQTDGGRRVVMLQPRHRHLALWLAGLVPLLGLALLLAYAGGRRRGNLLAARALQRALRATLMRHRDELRQAVERQDSIRFYAAAEQLVQQQLAACWGVAPDDVTPQRIAQRIGPAGAPLAVVLHDAQAIRYAGHLPSSDGLAALAQAVEQQLASTASLYAPGMAEDARGG